MTVAGMSSAVIGLSVTVALVIVISVTIVIISLVVMLYYFMKEVTPSAEAGINGENIMGNGK